MTEVKCPSCGSTEYEGLDQSDNETEIVVFASCRACNAEFEVKYTLDEIKLTSNEDDSDESDEDEEED